MAAYFLASATRLLARHPDTVRSEVWKRPPFLAPKIVWPNGNQPAINRIKLNNAAGNKNPDKSGYAELCRSIVVRWSEQSFLYLKEFKEIDLFFIPSVIP